VIIVLGTDFFFDLDLLFLSTMMGKEELAVIGVCARVFMLVSFGVTAVYAVTLPDIFESGIKQAMPSSLKRSATPMSRRRSSQSASSSASPSADHSFSCCSARSFSPAPCRSLCWVSACSCGPSPVPRPLPFRCRTGPNATLPAVGAGVVTLVAANLALVPTFGLLGAAIAATLAQSIWSIGMWLTALRVAKVDVSIVPRLRQLLEARRQAAVRNG
jgi:hypothetical protein